MIVRDCAYILIFRLVNFYDLESGITERFIGIGTTNTSDDVISMVKTENDTLVIPPTGRLNDGVLYYVVTKVF